MKKLLVFAMLIATGIVIGQEKEAVTKIEKGTWNFTTNLSVYNRSHTYNSENNKNEADQFSFNITPKLGYAVTDDFTIGIGLGYGHGNSKQKNDNVENQSTKFNSYDLFPYVKKHFFIANNFSFSLQGEFRYTYSKNKYSDSFSTSSNATNTNTYFIGVRPGITYFINKNFALEANLGSLGYTSVNNEYHNPNDSSTTKSNDDIFNFNFNTSQFYFGLSYYW